MSRRRCHTTECSLALGVLGVRPGMPPTSELVHDLWHLILCVCVCVWVLFSFFTVYLACQPGTLVAFLGGLFYAIHILHTGLPSLKPWAQAPFASVSCFRLLSGTRSCAKPENTKQPNPRPALGVATTWKPFLLLLSFPATSVPWMGWGKRFGGRSKAFRMS